MRKDKGFTRAFILGAGLGTRLRPLTDVLPKPLIPIFQDNLVVHAMSRCRKSGIRDFVINTHHLPDCWNKRFSSGVWEDCSVTLSHEPVLLDSGGGLRNIDGLIEKDRPLLVLNGDILSTLDLDILMANHLRSGAKVTLALRSVGDICNVGFDSSTGLVTDIRHELGVDPGSYQFAGIYCIDPDVLELIPQDPAVISIIPSWLELILRNKVAGVVLDEGLWMDVGSPEMYLEAHRVFSQWLPDSCHYISAQSWISPSSKIDEHCVIGKGARVEDSCNLSSCIVWPGVSVPQGTVARRAIFMSNELAPIFLS